MPQSIAAPFNPTFRTMMYDELMAGSTTGNQNWLTFNSGGSSGVTSVIGDEKHPSLSQFATGTTATGRAGQQWGSTANLMIGGGELMIESVLIVPTLSTSAQRFACRWGLGTSQTGDHADGVYFEYDESVSANFRLKAANSSVRTTVDSGVAVPANTFFRLKIVINDTTNAQFYVNGVLVGTISTNLPSNTTLLLAIVHIIKSVGTTSRTLQMDNFYFNEYFSAAR